VGKLPTSLDRPFGVLEVKMSERAIDAVKSDGNTVVFEDVLDGAILHAPLSDTLLRIFTLYASRN
jgi:hypothetical protein